MLIMTCKFINNFNLFKVFLKFRNENEHFIIKPNISTFQSSFIKSCNTQALLAAKFDDMVFFK